MTHQTPKTTCGTLHEQAVYWIVRLQSGSASADERRDFDSWLASSPEHRQEYEEVSLMWGQLDDTQSLLQSELQKADALWADHVKSRQPAAGWAWPRWGQAAAAGTALFVLLVTAWWWMDLPRTTPYETAKGSQRQETLADGSVVMLNTDTKLTVEYSRHARVIRLERGEAWFTVRHDEQRPFTVQIANGTVRDIGTQFIIKKDPDHVRVQVWEGLVEVGLHGVSAPRPMRLRAGEQVAYGSDGHMSDAESFDRERAGSWKEGTLVFRSQPLVQVLAEIARYRPEEIRLLDQGLSEFSVSGVFNLHELDRAMETLEASLPIRAQRVRENLILIERAPASSNARSLPHPSK